MRTEKPAQRVRSCSPRRSRGETSTPSMRPQPRWGDIRPPPIRMLIAPATDINHSALASAALSRLGTLLMPPLPGLRLNRGAMLIPRLDHGLQDAAADAA